MPAALTYKIEWFVHVTHPPDRRTLGSAMELARPALAELPNG